MVSSETFKQVGNGFVTLVGVLGDDEHIWRCSGISRGRSWSAPSPSDGVVRKLIEFFFVKKHASPFEFGVLQFRMKLPIYVARQLMRYRTYSWIERSGRYCGLDSEFTGGDGFGVRFKREVSTDARIMCDAKVKWAREMLFSLNRYLIDSGVSYEQARKWLPQDMMTEVILSANLRNLMNMFDQRLDPHAQEETRAFAQAIHDLTALAFPITMECYDSGRTTGSCPS